MICCDAQPILDHEIRINRRVSPSINSQEYYASLGCIAFGGPIAYDHHQRICGPTPLSNRYAAPTHRLLAQVMAQLADPAFVVDAIPGHRSGPRRLSPIAATYVARRTLRRARCRSFLERTAQP